MLLHADTPTPKFLNRWPPPLLIRLFQVKQRKVAVGMAALPRSSMVAPPNRIRRSGPPRTDRTTE